MSNAPDPRHRQELAELVTRAVEGDADAARRARLAELLETYPVLIDDYVQLAHIRAAVHCDAIATPAASVADPGTTRRSVIATIGPVPAVAAAVLVVAAVVVTVIVAASGDPDPAPSPAPSSTPVATLIDAAPGTQVMVNDDLANPGSEYTTGSYAIESGDAEFLLKNRVTVRLSGPTLLHVHNPMLATLVRGSVEFVCPSGTEGFTVNLPDDSRIVDLGTRFRIDVEDTDAFEFRVLEGKVAWKRGDDAEVVHAAQIIRIEGTRISRLAEIGPRDKQVEIGPLRHGGFDIGFDWPPDNQSQFIGIHEASDAWVETVKHPRVRLFSDDRLIAAHSPPTYAELMSGDTSGGAGVIQVVRTTPGVEYELVAQLARSNGGSAPTVAMDVADGPVDGLEPGDLRHERVRIDWPTRTWREHRVRFVARSDVTTVRIFEPLDSETRGPSPLIDSIQLNPLDTHPDRSFGEHDARPTPSLNEGVDE